MAKASQLTLDQMPPVVSTTDGTSTVTILTVPAFAANDGGQGITFDVVGNDFDNDEVATAKIHVKLKNVGGTPTMVGSPVHLVPISAGSSSGLVTASVNVVISGTNLKVNVIGVASRTIYWTATRWPSVQVLDGYTTVNPITLDGIVAGGDLSGTYPNPTVAKIRGTLVDGSAPTDLNLLQFIDGTSSWTPVTPAQAIQDVPLFGDVTGTLSGPGVTVVKLQNNALKDETPGSQEDGYVITWINSNNQFEIKPPVLPGSIHLAGDVTGVDNANTVEALTGLSTTIGGNPADLITLGDGGSSPTAFFLKRQSFSGTGETAAALHIGGANNSGANNAGSVYIYGGESASGQHGGVIIGYNPLTLQNGAGVTIAAGQNGGGIVLTTTAAGTGAHIYLRADSANNGKIGIQTVTASTVGAAGGASALPATPSGYLVIRLGDTGGSFTDVKIPYYAT